MIFASNDNEVEENKIGGNINGVYIDANGDVGNVIRRNSVLGNPPGQVSKEFGASIGADIQDMSAPGANIFEDNRCLTYAGTTVPAPCPMIPKGNDVEAQYHDRVGPSIAITHARQADVGLMNFGKGTTWAGAAALLILGLVVPIRRSRNLSGKN